MIEVRLFGDLRYMAGAVTAPGTPIHLPGNCSKTAGQVLAELGIDPAKVSHLFLNGHLLPRALYPITLGYPLTAECPLSLQDWLETPVYSGDRLGIFPLKMGLVVV